MMKQWVIDGMYEFTCNGVRHTGECHLSPRAFSEAEALKRGLRDTRYHLRREYEQIRGLRWLSYKIVSEGG